MFDPARKKLLFFSRGRGRGHAVLDLSIGKELASLRNDVHILYVSYGTGARTFHELGTPVIDLALPDANSLAATTVLAGRLIGHLQPDLVVAHEECAALPASKIFGKHSVLITDYFTEPGTFATESIWFADRILFLDRKNRVSEPASAAGKVQYLGLQIRPFLYRRRDRGRARRELQLPPETTVIAVFPGSWTEARAALFDVFLTRFDQAQLGHKRLVWLGGEDADNLRRRLHKRQDITVLTTEWQVDRLMVACDIAVTKTNRMTVRELASLGIRTLSLDFGLNPTDVACIAPLRANRTVAIDSFQAVDLEERFHARLPVPLRPPRISCAAALSQLLD